MAIQRITWAQMEKELNKFDSNFFCPFPMGMQVNTGNYQINICDCRDLSSFNIDFAVEVLDRNGKQIWRANIVK